MNIGSIGRKATGMCLAVLVGSVLGGTALAQGQPGQGPLARALKGGLATLDLSPEQKDAIKSLVEAKKPALQALHAQVKTDAKALHDAASATTPDPAKVGAAFLKVRADREAVQAGVKALLDDIKAVLTPDQQKKLEGYLAALRQMHRARAGGAANG